MNRNKRIGAIVACGIILAVLLGHFGHAVLAGDQVGDDQPGEGHKPAIAAEDAIPPAANRYALVSTALQAGGPIEDADADTLVRIRGLNPENLPRKFEVLFGPSPADAGPGRGRFTNNDPTWDCVQGYALLRGIRPSGSTQYVKATSDSTTIILHVNDAAGEHRVIVTEAEEGAKVWLVHGGDKPDKPNLTEGHVRIVTIKGGTATLGEPIAIEADPVSCNLVNELVRRADVNYTGGLEPVNCNDLP